MRTRRLVVQTSGRPCVGTTSCGVCDMVGVDARARVSTLRGRGRKEAMADLGETPPRTAATSTGMALMNSCGEGEEGWGGGGTAESWGVNEGVLER
jgi:hypothetical protein